MSYHMKTVHPMKLVLILCFQLLSNSRARHVSEVVPSLQEDDLEVAAAEPRPVIVEPPQQAEVLPLIAEDNSFGDSALSEASEKVEKVLKRPLAFSYQNQDQSAEGTEVSDDEEREAKVRETDGFAESNEETGSTEKIQNHANADKTDENEKLHGEYLDDIQYVEDSAVEDTQVHSHHKKAGGGGGGHGGHHEKGGGKEHHASHKGSKGEKGDKGYKGHHHHEKGEKGHHTKEGHEKEYEEKGGQKKKHHHDDGYKAEHHKGEKGHKGSKFKEEGKHSKGHSTKGEHTIHKKDEYDKKQEFYDESYEEDGVEKEGNYFHESDYKKGGHEKGGFDKGGEESAHYGKKHHHDKGGHFKEGKGHKDAKGHDSHYDHEHKNGEKESDSGGKKWAYSKGKGGGGGGGGGGEGHKHGGKYEQADASNMPVHVIHPNDQQYKDTIAQSNIPKLILEEDPNIKKLDVIYPPLSDFHSQPINKRKPKHHHSYNNYETYTAPKNVKHVEPHKNIFPDSDETILKPNYKQTEPSKIAFPVRHDKSIVERLIIQRRNDDDVEDEDNKYDKDNLETGRKDDDVEDEENKDAKDNFETGRKDDVEDEDNKDVKDNFETGRKEDYTLFTSVINARKDNTIPNKEKNDQDLEHTKRFKSTETKKQQPRIGKRLDYTEYEDLIDDTVDKQSQEIGAYSIFILGDYTTQTAVSVSPKVVDKETYTPQIPPKNIIYDEIQIQKPQYVAISSDATDNLNSEEIYPTTEQNVDDKPYSVTSKKNIVIPNEIASSTRINRTGFRKENHLSESAAVDPGSYESLKYIVTVPPEIQSSGYEKPKYVTISSETENYESIEDLTIPTASENTALESTAKSIATTFPEKVNYENNLQEQTDTEELRRKKQCINKQKRHKKENNDENYSTSMKPIVVEDIRSEEIDN